MSESETKKTVRAILIAGPTASGKSALALELAKEFDGVIVNADSMQVYAELRIITNRPTPADEAAVPHRLYGFRPAREPYSAALWLHDISAVLSDIAHNRKLAVIVGGTGLYFKALTEGLSHIPDIPAEIRARWRLAAQEQRSEALHAELARRDPLTASQLRPSDPQRIVRALEVLDATGRPLAAWQGQRQAPVLPLARAFPIAIMPEREVLYRRCNARFDTMLEQGALGEAEAIAALGLDAKLPAIRAVGLPPLLAHCRGQLSLEEASIRAKAQTRNYAKRQLTWINGNFMSWNIKNKKLSERTKHEINIYCQKCLTAHH